MGGRMSIPAVAYSVVCDARIGHRHDILYRNLSAIITLEARRWAADRILIRGQGLDFLGAYEDQFIPHAPSQKL